jgi:hypothetical protein
VTLFGTEDDWPPPELVLSTAEELVDETESLDEDP